MEDSTIEQRPMKDQTTTAKKKTDDDSENMIHQVVKMDVCEMFQDQQT